MIRIAIGFVLVVFSVPLQSSAEAPALYPLQGFLTTDLGAPIDGPVNVSFALYDADIGGALLWSESQGVPIQKGHFTVYLGTVAPLAAALFSSHTGVWLGITVAGDDEMPRVRLGSVPYSAYAQYCGEAANVAPHSHSAQDVSGVALAGQQCGSGQVMSGITAAGLPLCVTANQSSGGNANNGVTGSGSAKRLAKFLTSTSVGNSIVYESNNKVGINDSTPQRTLDVKGDLQVTGDFYWGGKAFSTSSCIVIGGSSCSSACGSHGMSCYKAFAIDKDNNGSTSCSQSGFKFCCCRN